MKITITVEEPGKVPSRVEVEGFADRPNEAYVLLDTALKAAGLE